MAYEIRELTEQEREERGAKSGHTWKPFALFDGKMCLSDHGTREEAERELRTWEGRDLITNRVQEFLDEMYDFGNQYNLAPDEVKAIVHDA